MAVLVFLLSAAAVVWTLAGFPLLLARRAAAVPADVPPLLDEAALPTVTAIVPVHNGERFLVPKIQGLLAADYPPGLLDVIIVSDGSTDATDVLAESLATDPRVRFFRREKAGKAVALSAAFAQSSADMLLLTDVRQTLEPDCVRRLAECLADPAVGIVSGTLRIRDGMTSGEASTGLYWKYELWIRTNLSRLDSVLGATGAICAIRGSLARPLPPGCILDDMWLPLQVVLDGYRATLSTRAVAWDFPTSLTSEFSRKVRTQAGIYQLLALEPRLLNPAQHRLFWSFVNLKLLRLLLPHFLLIAFVSSLFLPPSIRAGALLAQALFYGAAFADRFVPERSLLKRATTPIAAFVTLVWAAFCAQTIFFRDPASLWKPTQVPAGTSGSTR